MKPEMRTKIMAEVKQLTENPDSIVFSIANENIDEDKKIYYITAVYTKHLRSLQYIHQVLSEKKMAQNR